ncbi:hypothetical protein [Tenacibaculum sp. M341]|uniref:hypothetical protein n=1 Tax=Tenacibaculum sp. M341 TaxID=2530339 RepID=UPI00140508D9|nr:hypothetical protein [Tenacibaculum sp. M341]
MKKSILNLGKQLNKNEQTLINGGVVLECHSDNECPGGYLCMGCICRLEGDFF